MAAGLAAAIESAFGITSTLVVGHDGIYTVAINGETVYDNQSTCSGGLPRHEEILASIARVASLAMDPEAAGSPATEGDGAACTWPLATKPAFEVIEPAGDCGCGGGENSGTTRS